MKKKQRIIKAVNKTAKRAVGLDKLIKKAVVPRGQSIFLTAVPKSASTFVSSALAEVTGYIPYSLSEEHLLEQNLSTVRLSDAWGMSTVSHQHVRAREKNIEKLAEHTIKPVVMTRNIMDALVSLCDHFKKYGPENPLVELPENFFQENDEWQYDFLVDYIGPWYVAFVAEWNEVRNVPTLWVKYNDVKETPEAVLKQILAFYEIEHLDKDIDDALARVQSKGDYRLNKAVSGRGAAELNENQKKRLAALASYHPEIADLLFSH